MDGDPELPNRILASLDSLLHAFELEPTGEPDRFAARAETGRFIRVFGGQLLAQALVAAASVTPGKAPQSLHAYFVEAGTPGAPLTMQVDRVRDGRSMATRRVNVLEGDRVLLTAIASFHDNVDTPAWEPAPPQAAEPTTLPLLQEHAVAVDREIWEQTRTWVDTPPPIEIRMVEPPTFMGAPATEGTRSHWMRLPRPVGDEPAVHAALLAYASDYFLLDMAFRSHPDHDGPTSLGGVSLDHSIWFHRPTRFDAWHLHTQETLAIVGHRSLVRGSIHDAAGRLVASATQEVLVRPSQRIR